MFYPINICHVVFSLDFGGLEKVVIDLAEGVDKKKYRVVICCLDKLGDLAKEAESKGIKVIFVSRKAGLDFGLPFRLSRVFKKENVSIVHSHNFAPMLYSTLGAKLAKVSFVLNTIHGREKKVRHNRIWSMVWKLNDFIVTISNDARNEFLKYAKVDSGRIKVIHNGIDISKFVNNNDCNDLKAKLGISASDYVIGTVSRLSLEKDQFTLLDTFERITENLSNVKLLIVGDGKSRGELEDYSRRLRIEGKVLFLGFRNDIAEILSIMDIFVLTSLTEGISVSLLEAMAASKPVVATNVGGNAEVIEDGKTGFLVRPKNPEKIAENIIALLKNRSLSTQMGKKGKERVTENFSLKRMISEYESLYKKCPNKQES